MASITSYSYPVICFGIGISLTKLSKLVFDLGSGRVKKTDNIDYAVGIVLNYQLGDKIKKGDVLGTIYYNKKINDMANIFTSAFKIEKKKKAKSKIILKTVK